MIEEDFEDNSNTRTVGLVIEEAKNYDSVNTSKQSEHRKSILKNKQTKQEEIPIEVEDEEYVDDEFNASSGSEMLAKVSVSQSGRLPPLSSSYPFVATQKSESFFDSGSKVGDSKNKFSHRAQ